MQDKHLFEYAVMRVVPKVEREEFLNIGIILFCKSKKYLDCIYRIDKVRLDALCAELDCTEIDTYLLSFENICKGNEAAGIIGTLDIASRFRWLTATRSTIVQTSKVHPGFTNEPQQTLHKLFDKLVL